jgi:hypothetical protein
MRTYTATLPVEWTREEILDSVYGNGAFAWEWWVELEFPATPENTTDVIATGKFGDDDDWSDFAVTFDSWLRALAKTATLYPHWRSSIIDKDIDADLGDVILQVAVHGDTVYG